MVGDEVELRDFWLVMCSVFTCHTDPVLSLRTHSAWLTCWMDHAEDFLHQAAGTFLLVCLCVCVYVCV